MNRPANLEDADRARRLEEMGITVRSAEISELVQSHNEFVARGGNRAMRRATKRAQKKRRH